MTENLQSLLEELSRSSDSTQDMQRRVEICLAALKLVDRSQQPQLWAAIQSELGNSLAQSPSGSEPENTKQAIHHYQQALEVYTREIFPEQWAAIHFNLASAYYSCIQGERAENLEQAFYYYQQALEVYTREAFPEQWAAVQHNLATAYYARIRGEQAENLEQAIYHYQQALDVRTREAFPTDWAMTQNNLANAYYSRIRGQRAYNLEQAIHYYQQALLVYSRNAFPADWAMIQNNLATAYSDRIRGKRAENLEQAIYHYQQALHEYPRDTFPTDWAMIQHNLANTYSERIRGERTENLERAIHYFESALKVYTLDDFPEQWATTHNDLGNTWADRIQGERAENLEKAIQHFQIALEVRTREAFPVDWAITQNNLGLAYQSRIQGKRAENIEQAFHHYRQALEVRTREAFPVDWAMTQNNLAGAYYSRIQGEEARNMEHAVYHYQQALKVYARDAFPTDWAKAHHNLGTAYVKRIRGERAANLKQAIRHFSQALEIYSGEAFPAEHRWTQYSLGNLHFNEQQWTEALKAYQAAIEVGDNQLEVAYTEAGRRAEVGKSTYQYANAAYCLLQTGQPAEALLTHERGKTRLLVEALALAEANLSMLPQAQQMQIQETRDAIRVLEAAMRLPPDASARRDDRELAESLREARATLNTLVEEIRRDRPDFMPQGLDLPNLLALAPKGGALVAPLVTSQGSTIFVVPHGVKEVTEEHVIRLDRYTEEMLSNLLRGPADDPGWGGWMGVYFEFRDRQTPQAQEAWQAAIERFTSEIWDALLAPVHERLQELGVKRVILMPAGGLQLLPLHASWRQENGAKRYFIDDYEVICAPSGYALETSRRRAGEREGRAALVAGINRYADPQVRPLVNAMPEARVLAALLRAEPLLDEQATEAAIQTGAVGKAFLHLSCHGYFDWGDPLASGLICHDTPLTLAEVIGSLNLDAARLVTLSACETGITDVRRSPDEYVGLPAGFLQAGAPAVVSSLWAVDDRSTALLMERFYRNHLEKGMALPAALREAQLWLRDATRDQIGEHYKSYLRMSKEEAQDAAVELARKWHKPDDRPYASPYYWAAFTFNGA